MHGPDEISTGAWSISWPTNRPTVPWIPREIATSPQSITSILTSSSSSLVTLAPNYGLVVRRYIQCRTGQTPNRCPNPHFPTGPTCHACHRSSTVHLFGQSLVRYANEHRVRSYDQCSSHARVRSECPSSNSETDLPGAGCWEWKWVDGRDGSSNVD